VKKINNYITKKVADKLAELFKNDRKAFEDKWQDIGLFVKYGMLSDEKFYDKAKEYALFENVAHERFTLEEYKNKIEPQQTDKNGTVVYLYSDDPQRHNAFIQSAERKGYDVLLMDSPIDGHFISHMEHKLEKTRLKRVDADVADKLIDKEENIPHVLSEEETGKIKGIFEKGIAKPNMQVSVESLSPDEMPVTVTMDEFSRRMKDMAKMGGPMAMYGAMPDNYKVSLNGNHPLISRILNTADEAEQTRLTKQAFDLALLSQGMLTGADLTEFVKRSVDLI
jgi:molecular chaperone HtpG